MGEEKQEATLTALREFLRSKDWSILSDKDIQAGRQFIISDGVSTIPVNCFRTGTIQVQGPDSPLKSALQTWIQERRKPRSSPPSLW